MRDRIDRGSPVPLYEQIAGAIRWMVATGDIRHGVALEATRDAAERWGVNRHTVRQAYQRLVQWGLAESRPPHRFVIVANAQPAEEIASDGERTRFFDEVLRHAADRFGLEPQQLISTLQRHAYARGAQQHAVTVIECNTTQAEDHARQIAERWGVQTLPFVLGRSAELPPGPVVCTVFQE